MKDITRYIADYFRYVDKKLLALCSLQTAILIWFNYYYGFERWLEHTKTLAWPWFTGHFILFLVAFSFPYIYYALIGKKIFFRNKPFNFLLVAAPAIFALKMAWPTQLSFSVDDYWNEYWNVIYNWPARLLVVMAILIMVWKNFGEEIFGQKKINWKPYILMLLIMLPLIAAASTQHDFLKIYPKLQTSLSSSAPLSFWHKLLFELSYGSDFFTIEIFFRGFLILAFIKWAGMDAILPMACFYCTIHFGKPLGECISSYFGGMLLGIVVYNTRSIFGGLMVHLGIAWLMELGGYIGHSFF